MTTLYSRKSIGLSPWALVVCLATLGLGLSATARQPTFTTFDAPGAGTGADQGTIPFDITPAGEITGFTRDAAFARHGFVRARNGAIAVFDAPDAGTGAGQGTFAPIFGFNINPQGTITGNYIDASNVSHGFVRAPDGTLTTFDAPGAGSTTDSFQGTYPSSINQAGAICGAYIDDSNVFHSFVRAPDGTLTTFDAPGAGTGAFQGTVAFANNPAGAITGYYLDESNVNHGFVRAHNGTFTTFDAPGAGTGAFQGTVANSNNPAGAITGYYTDANDVIHGFLRNP